MAGWHPASTTAGRILQSERIIDRPWMKLRRDRVVEAAGNAAEYVAVEFPDWVDVIALTAELDIVLVEQYRLPVRARCMEFPAGVVDQHELPLQAARRELLEETGYVSDHWHVLGSMPVNPDWQSNRVHSYLALNARRGGDQDLDSGEVIHRRELPFPTFLNRLEAGALELPALQVGELYLLQQFLRRTPDPTLAALKARAGL